MKLGIDFQFVCGVRRWRHKLLLRIIPIFSLNCFAGVRLSNYAKMAVTVKLSQNIKLSTV